MLSLKDTFPIGIGTYRIDESDRADALWGLHHSFERGQNMMSTGFSYGKGAVVDILGDFIPAIDREKLFLYTYVEPNVGSLAGVRTQLEDYLRILKTDYIDCYQIHIPLETPLPMDGIYDEILKLKEEGKIRYIGASNLSHQELLDLSSRMELLSFEGLYNLECKTYEHLGTLDLCRERNMEFICYQPLRRNRIAKRDYPLLREMAEKYGRTQNQILLNWIIREKGLRAMVKSVTHANIDANLDSLSFTLEPEDCQKLNDFRCPECDSIPVDWTGDGNGVQINYLGNQF